MRSRQAHTALRSGTTHATPPTAPPRMRGACHYAEVHPRRALRHSKIAHLLSATSTFLAGHLHLESSPTISAKPVGAWAGFQPVDSRGRTIWIADAHHDDGKPFIVHADEKLTALLELESAIRVKREPLH